MFNSYFFLFSLLLFTTYIRYFEFGIVNVYILFNILAIMLVAIEQKKLAINRNLMFLFVFDFYVFLHLFFLTERYSSYVLLTISIMCSWVWCFIGENISWEKIIKITLFAFSMHLILAIMQRISGLDFLFISDSLGFFNGAEDGQILKQRVPGLSFISGNFYAPISLALAYLLRTHKKIFLIAVCIILYVNISKVFIPSLLILMLYDRFYVNKYGVKTIHLFMLVFLINVIGFTYAVIQYIGNPTLMSTFSSRALYLIYLIENIKISPILGIGFDNFKEHVSIIYDEMNVLYFPHNPHNVFIKFLSELGIVGFTIFITAIYKGSKVPSYAKKDERIIVLSYAIYFILVQLSFHNFHFMSDIYIYIGLLVGIKSQIRYEKNEI